MSIDPRKLKKGDRVYDPAWRLTYTIVAVSKSGEVTIDASDVRKRWPFDTKLVSFPYSVARTFQRVSQGKA
jgi:hypothetical protein